MNERRIINGTEKHLDLFPEVRLVVCRRRRAIWNIRHHLVEIGVIRLFRNFHRKRPSRIPHVSYIYKSYKTLREINKFQVSPQYTYKHDLIIFFLNIACIFLTLYVRRFIAGEVNNFINLIRFTLDYVTS